MGGVRKDREEDHYKTHFNKLIRKFYEQSQSIYIPEIDPVITDIISGGNFPQLQCDQRLLSAVSKVRSFAVHDTDGNNLL